MLKVKKCENIITKEQIVKINKKATYKFKTWIGINILYTLVGIFIEKHLQYRNNFNSRMLGHDLFNETSI